MTRTNEAAATLTRPAAGTRRRFPMQVQSTIPSFGDPRLPMRFWSKVNPDGPIPVHRPDLGPCWVWTAGLYRNGYAQFQAGSRSDGTRKMVYGHRLAYEHLVGSFPPGLQADHLCRNHPCVRPSHIEAVTRRENILRGTGASARAARATACPQGHPYDEPNTYRAPKGGRYCRACAAIT